MSLYDIRLLYIRELRAAFRERGILVNSVLVPLLIYPVLLWLIFSAIAFIKGREESMPSRLALVSIPAAHAEIEAFFAEDEHFQLLDARLGTADVEALRNDELDLYVSFEDVSSEDVSFETIMDNDGVDSGDSSQAPWRPADPGPVNFTVALTWNSADDRSSRAKARFEEKLEDYRRQWQEKAAAEFGVDPESWLGFGIELENVASSEDVGAFFLGLLAPMLMMVMIAVGCFYPAVDTTAGERERSTWETSMTLGVSHASILVAKYLYVATLGALAGLLNLGAMALTMAALLRPLLGGGDAVSFGIPWRALPILLIATFAFALMVAAGMMLFAVFARTFKEGQAMIAPVYMFCLLPPMMVTSPDLTLNFKWALVPVANLCLLFRQAITGNLDWPLALLVLVLQALIVAVLLLAARWVLRFEDVTVGTYEGSLTRWLKERWLDRKGHHPKEKATD